MSEARNCYFSICIPSYNRAYTLNRCLDSLVDQTYKDFEVIFVDDGSTDDTEQVVREYESRLNLRYIKKNNGGKHTALNTGIKEAGNTELFMILDSDDWLKKDALETFYRLWETEGIKSHKKYCGVMARCADQNERLIGQAFPTSPHVLDYVTFHFGGADYGDCDECIRTSLIKQYHFPEPKKTKFVPEYYIFDQIGVYYDLYCVNTITENKEYCNDGMTVNNEDHVRKNWIGYFCATTCRLDRVVPFSGGRIKVRQILLMWYNYWRYCYYDAEHLGERVSRVTFWGCIGKLIFIFKRVLVMLSVKERI